MLFKCSGTYRLSYDKHGPEAYTLSLSLRHKQIFFSITSNVNHQDSNKLYIILQDANYQDSKYNHTKHSPPQTHTHSCARTQTHIKVTCMQHSPQDAEQLHWSNQQ